jgi:tetratricopeptide (TPR) repeat protein
MNRPRLALLLFAVLAWGPGATPVSAMFAFSETEPVPVERLLANLARKLRADTNDLAATYQLARVHSMIYATNALQLNVAKQSGEIQFAWPGSDSGVPGKVKHPPDADVLRRAAEHLAQALLLYERSLVLLRGSSDGKAEWWILPMHLGYAWCLEQAGRRDDAIDGYRKTLDIAWQKEVIGDFHFQEWLGQRWEDIKARRNPLKGSRRGYVGPGVCFSEETIGYLLKLLDPVKDQREIADLKDRQKELLTMGRAITPVVVPLTDRTDLAELVDSSARVEFDLDGSGLKKSWGWITPRAAWLVFDRDGRGEINSALQLLGSVSFWVFWRDGYDALAALDDDGNGVLEGPELTGLALWRDANGNGVSDPGEVRPVTQWGITGLSTTAEAGDRDFPWNPRGVRFNADHWRPTYDWVAPGEPVSSVQ